MLSDFSHQEVWEVYFQGCEDDIGNAENYADKDSCMMWMNHALNTCILWLLVIPSGQEGGYELF